MEDLRWFVPVCLTLLMTVVLWWDYHMDYKAAAEHYDGSYLFSCIMMVLITFYVGVVVNEQRTFFIPTDEACDLYGREPQEKETEKEK